jgi:CelD/BcsL family acetyltransferase involved in cellulose biosynthesis
MQIAFIDHPQQFETINPDWNKLLQTSIIDVPFLRHEYLSLWWQTLGGGEWGSAELMVAVGKNPLDEIVAIAPLFKPKEDRTRPRLMFIGSIEISDYLDLIVSENDLEQFVKGMFDSLEERDREEWVDLDLYNLPDWSPSVEVLTDEAKRRGWETSSEIYQPCPVITLPSTWDDYLSGIKKKQRHELRRKLRRAENYAEPVRFHIVSRDDDLDNVIADYLQLMSYDTRKQGFLTAPMRENVQDVVRLAMQEGYLLLVFLYVGDTAAAAYMHFDYGNRIWVYNSGINPAYLDLSPGWVLLGRTIQWGIENGREALDFMRGDEIYKYRLGGVDRNVLRLLVSR